MESNFNNGPHGPTWRGRSTTAGAANRQATSPPLPLPEAQSRRSCDSVRAAGSNQPKKATPQFCTHREVKPYAGTTGFDPEAWCVDCQYYKLRRAPKKRNPDDYRY